MKGDIVLCTSDPKRPSFMDAIISHVTNGRFTHVEMDIGDGRVIGALLNGVEEYDASVGPDFIYVTPSASPADIDAGIAWLKTQVGKKYGWLDIGKDALKWMGLSSIPLSDGTYDCSDLATRYLLAIKDTRILPKLGSAVKDPSTISPNDIARASGVKV